MFAIKHKYYITERIIYLLIIFVIPFQTAYNQENTNIHFHRITTENYIIEKGLSQNTVRTVIQDNKGFLWFGTWDGLNKYDAYSFKIYNEENGLSNSGVHCLYEDNNGMLEINLYPPGVS